MTPAAEFSRPFVLDRLGAGGFEETVAATPAECAALAVRFGVPGVQALACRWRLRRGPAGRVEAEGRLTARLTRECVITLEEFEATATEEFRVAFVPQGAESDDDDPEAIDEIPYAGNAIDLGEAAAEQLALTLDPYPHKPGAALPSFDEPDERASPFGALARRGKPA